MSDCCGPIIYQGLCKRGRPVEVMDCAVCGFKHLHPKPLPADLDLFYRLTYFSEVKPDYAATSGTESEYQFEVDDEKIGALGPVPFNPDVFRRPRVLDFGCGPSAPFLKHWVKLRGPDSASLFGVEISQKDPVRELDVGGAEAGVVNSLDRLSCREDKRFHVVHLGFVLEHVVNPIQTLMEIKGHLTPGARIVIEVPNDFNPLQMHLWHRLAGVPWWVSSPDHAIYWDEPSLFGVLSRAGFRPWVTSTTYPVELFIAHGQDFRTDPAAAGAVVERRADLQRMWRDCVKMNLFGHKIGRTIWVVATCE